MTYDDRYGRFLVELGKKTGQVAVCEAAHKAYKACCESSKHQYFDEVYSTTAAVWLNRQEKTNTDPYISLNIPADVLTQIDAVLPDAVNQFNSEYSYSGEGVDVSVRSYGENASWNGRDTDTYDPGYGETECEIDGDVQAYVYNLMQHWIDDADDMFPGETSQTIASKVADVRELIKPYIDTAVVY